MTRILRYAGVQLADNTVRLEDGIAGLTECADGSLGTAGVRFDDPTGADTYTLLQRFEIDETDCVLPRMFTGYSYNVRNNRGPFRIDAGRTHDLDIGDLNFLLHLQPAGRVEPEHVRRGRLHRVLRGRDHAGPVRLLVG
jgi:hypothetical protein